MRRLPLDLRNKLNSPLQVKSLDADPKMSVSIARPQSSIQDNTYFKIETIRKREADENVELGDIAVAGRRLVAEGPPDSIYGIHVENDIAKTSIRRYPDTFEEGWVHQFDVGPAVNVALAFDGVYVRNRYNKWGLVTKEKPFIFWRDSLGQLKVKLWDEGVDLLLSSNVVKLDAIRGWIPTQPDHTSDQGLIVAYTKSDSKVYYRNYCMQPDGVYVWESEKEVTQLGAGNTEIRLCRTNDYRVGFLTGSKNNNKFIVTDRNWAAMSNPDHRFHANVNAKIQLVSLGRTYVDAPDHRFNVDVDTEFYLCDSDIPELEVLNTERAYTVDDKVRLLLTMTHPVTSTVVPEDFKAFDQNDIPVTIESVALVEGDIVLVTAYVDKTLDIRIEYERHHHRVEAVINNRCLKTLEEFSLNNEGVPTEGYIRDSFNVEVIFTPDLWEVVPIDLEDEHSFNVTVNTTIQLWPVEDAPV